MVLIAAGAVWLLLGLSAGRDQLDAIRTGGTIGVGLGGVVVLWLAVRRQRSTELDLLQKYAAHQLAERVARTNEAHQQRVAQDAREDATERRITELYTKAADQLGSDKAPVRLAGLYALERLAQNNEDQRQTIVNVLCAYLRMPYSLPGEPPPDDADGKLADTYRERVQEREVRLAAQRILIHHLSPDDPDHPVETFWTDLNLDLTDATLINFDPRDCRINSATFTQAKFSGTTSFSYTQFTGDALFNKAKFTEDTSFTKAEFTGDVWFSDAEFTGDISFREAKFTGYVWFTGAEFTEYARFTKAEFTGDTSFNGAKFTGDTSFSDAKFTGDTSFDKAKFAMGTPANVAQYLAPPRNSNTSSAPSEGDADAPAASST